MGKGLNHGPTDSRGRLVFGLFAVAILLLGAGFALLTAEDEDTSVRLNEVLAKYGFEERSRDVTIGTDAMPHVDSIDYEAPSTDSQMSEKLVSELKAAFPSFEYSQEVLLEGDIVMPLEPPDDYDATAVMGIYHNFRLPLEQGGRLRYIYVFENTSLASETTQSLTVWVKSSVLKRLLFRARSKP